MSLDQENPKRTENIPHSGNLPEGLRELPVSPDGTPLRAGLNAPDHVGDLTGGYVPGAAAEADASRRAHKAAEAKETPKGFFQRKYVIPALIASGLVLGGGVATAAVVNSQSQEVSDPAPGEVDPILPPEGEEEPAPEVERYEGSDFERTTALPENLQYIDDMSADEYRSQLSQIPLADRVAWASWADQYINEYAAYFLTVTGKPSDAPMPLVDGDFNSMLSSYQYQMRVAESFGTGTPQDMDTNGALDTELIEKYLASLIVGATAPQEIDGLIASMGKDGQAINVVLEARLDRASFLEMAQNDPNTVAVPETVVIDGVVYNGLRYGYVDQETGENHNGTFVVVGGRTVLVI